MNKTHSNTKTEKYTYHKFFERFINLTDTEFNHQERNLIEKGFKHNININSSTKNFETLGIDTELALKDCANNLEATHLAANIIKSEFMKSSTKL